MRRCLCGLTPQRSYSCPMCTLPPLFPYWSNQRFLSTWSVELCSLLSKRHLLCVFVLAGHSYTCQARNVHRPRGQATIFFEMKALHTISSPCSAHSMSAALRFSWPRPCSLTQTKWLLQDSSQTWMHPCSCWSRLSCWTLMLFFHRAASSSNASHTQLAHGQESTCRLYRPICARIYRTGVSQPHTASLDTHVPGDNQLGSGVHIQPLCCTSNHNRSWLDPLSTRCIDQAHDKFSGIYGHIRAKFRTVSHTREFPPCKKCFALILCCSCTVWRPWRYRADRRHHDTS